MRPHLPLVLLSALLSCFISPAWSDYTLTGNGETTISFADDQYTITPPQGEPLTQADSPGGIYLTDITASGTYQDGYNRVLNLEGGTYTGLQLWNVAGTAGGVTIGGNNSFVINIGEGTSLLNTNAQLMGWSNQDRIVSADITLNVDRNAGTINGFSLVGDGNKNDAYQTTGTYTVNIHGGEWAGISVSNPSSSWCIGLGQESFRHTGDVTFTINGGTFAQLVTAGTTRGAGQKSTIIGNVSLNLDGGTFNGSVALLGRGQVQLGDGTNAYTARLRITGGQYNANVYGLSDATSSGSAANIAEHSSASIEITGGTFAQSLFSQGVATTITGAAFSGDGTRKIFAGARLSTSAWNLADTNMTLDLGGNTVAAMIAGGSWVETGESTLNITGSTNLTFKSGTYTGQIWGGSYINGTATAALTGNIGSTNITITGGTFDGAQISLGTYVERNNANSALTIGEANLSISGGTFNNASIYAGGQKVNGTSLTTALASVTLTGNDAVFSGTTTISGQGRGDTVTRSVLNLNGVTREDMFENAVISGFDEISAGEGTDALIANATVLDGRSAFTKSGAGKLTLGSSAGFANALTVSAGELSFGLAGGVAFGNSITMGAGARLTSAGNMTLSPASVLTLDLTGLNSSSAAVIQSGGTLSFSTEGTLTLTISGVDQTMENDYRLIAADSFGTLTASNFSFDSSSLSEDYTYALELSGNTLYLRVKALGEALNWNGGSAGTWTATGGSAVWLDKDGTAIVYDASKSANFEDLAGISASAVTIDGNVSSARLTVNNGETAYTFTGTGTLVDGTGPMSLIKRGEGVLTIENTGANTFSGGTTIMAGTLNLNVVQGLGTGTVTLNGGELVLNTEGTTGLVATNNIIFGGGTFTYGTGAAQDISGLIDAAASTAAIRVNTNGNNISWATYTQELGNKDIVKLGNGLLTINMVQGGTFAGAITVNEGTLFYSIGDNSVTRTWSGNVSIAENATLQIQDNRAHNSVNTDTLSGRITGAGTLVLGKKEGGAFPGGGRYSVTGDNSGFTGTMRLAGNGVNAAWNEVGFANAAAIGGATLELDGRGFFVNSAADPINADIHVMAAGGWLNGNSNQTLVLAGSLTSEAGANLGITAAGDPTLTAIFTGDLTGFMGTVHSGRGNAIFSFGNGGAASTLDTGEFIKAVSLGGTGTYRVNYTGTAGNLLYAGNVIDTASLSIQGSDKLILTGANTTTGELNISQNSSVQLGDGTGDNAAWAGTIAGAGSLTVSTSGAFAVGDRANGLTGTLTLAKGTLDLSGAATTTNILIQSGALANAGSYAGTDANKVHVHAIADSGNIALGGLDAAGLGSVVTTAAGTQLTGLKQGSTWTVNGSDSNLAVGAGNISGDPFSGEDFLVQFEGTGDNLGSISFEDGSTLTLDLTSVMNAMKTAAGNLEILLTNGSFAQDLETLKSHITANPLFAALGFGIVGVNGGGIVLSGDTDLVYVSSVDGVGSADNPVTDQSLNFYQAVIVDRDLYVQSDGSMVIKNLTAPGTEPGQTGTGSLIVTNTAEDKGSIELQNNLFHDGAGVDTSFAGDISGLNGAAANTDLVKTGANKLTLSGNVSLAGDIIAEEGTLQLNGTADVEALHLNSADAGSPAVIGIGGRATARTLAGGDNGGKLDIAPSGTLTLTGATDGLSHTEISGPGTLAIAEGASLGLAADSTLSGVVLDLGGSLSLEADGSAGGLNGSGSLELNGQTLQIQAASGQTHTYDGTLGEGTLDVSGAGTQVLRSSGADTGLTVSGGNLVLQGNADVDGSRLSYGNLVNNGNLTIQASDNSLTAVNTTLSVENASFSSGSTTTFTLNTDADMTASFIEASGDVVIEDGASFHVTSIPDVNITWKSGNPMELTLMELTGNGTIDLGENTLTVGGLFLTYYKNAHLVQEGDKVVLKAEEQTDNIYAGVADTANSMAGANLLWDAARNGSVDQTVTDFLGALNKDMLNNPSAARHSLAAMAGSTVNALGTAQRDALRDQMGWIRNRTTLMGV
ncbi:autotransporter-associated beta strand repeat-containing protein, partial [uncultured Akkermansia sp.]|uniref:beta strand repeat-containing protein n=1 Tax=uncultured Akkermansia sp. TaxID=512294 RepID=UPI002632F54B